MPPIPKQRFFPAPSAPEDDLPQQHWSPNPYGPYAPAWDSSGYPVGVMPRGSKYALEYQYEANRRAEEYRRTLWGDAQNAMRQGLDLFQSYRPGGSAAAASGMYQAKAGLYGNQALSVEAPDMLMAWREKLRERAEKQANKLNENAQWISGFSSFNFLAGGTPTSLMQPPATPTDGQPQQGGSGQPSNAMPSGSSTPPVGGGGGGVLPLGGGSDSAPSTMPVQSAPLITSPGSVQLQGGDEAPGGGPGTSTVAGSYGAGGVGGGPGGGGGGRGRGRGGGGGVGVDGGMAGDAPLAAFNSPEVAGRSMAQAPGSFASTAEMWAEDPLRSESTALRVSSARNALLRAMRLDRSSGYNEAVTYA